MDKTEDDEPGEIAVMKNKDASFALELDQAFAEFNQIMNGLYTKYDKTAAEIWNATKRIMILRQKLEKKTEEFIWTRLNKIETRQYWRLNFLDFATSAFMSTLKFKLKVKFKV